MQLTQAIIAVDNSYAAAPRPRRQKREILQSGCGIGADADHVVVARVTRVDTASAPGVAARLR